VAEGGGGAAMPVELVAETPVADDLSEVALDYRLLRQHDELVSVLATFRAI
jgi:hypothetical protein